MAQIDPPEIPQNITINGVEYSPDEAQSLIETGTKTRELEKQWNTPVDKVWPEYGKTREQLQTIQGERDSARKELEDFKAKQNAGVETPTDVKEAQEAARKLGIVLGEDLEKHGYIKKEDLPGLFKTYSEEQRAIDNILSEGKKLEQEMDGSDGRPKFNSKVVMAYATAYNIPDLTKAYEEMHKEDLDKWKEHQVTSQKNKGLKTFGAGGAKSPKETKVTDDNVNDLMKEALYGNNE